MSDKKGEDAGTIRVRLMLNELKAVALFASPDETRLAIRGVHCEVHENKVLLVATDGRRLAALKATFDCNVGTGEFLIPPDFLGTLSKLIGNPKDTEQNKIQFEYDGKGEGKLKAQVETKHFKAELESIGIHYPSLQYPKWRQVIPNPFKQPKADCGRTYAFDSEYMAQYAQAARLLSKASKFGCRHGHIITTSEDVLQPIFIRLVNCKEFASVLMPLRGEPSMNDTLDWMDIDWKAGEAPKVETPKVEEAKAPAP